jgi:uncharacterized coiled-coil DUF342 family protein
MSSNKELLEQITRNMDALNHNSTTTARAVEKISECTNSLENAMIKGFTKLDEQHQRIIEMNNKTITIIKWLLIIIAGLAGVDLVI